MGMKTLSLVVPCLGASDLLPGLVAEVQALRPAVAQVGFDLVEVIIVDDGSQPPLVVPPEFKLLRNEVNRGKGFAVRRGALAAVGEWVLMSDMDCSAPLTEFARLAAVASEDAAMVCGSRYCVQRVGVPWRRRVLSRIFWGLTRVVGVHDIRDTQCGFKLFQMCLMRPLFTEQRISHFAFDVELIRAAQRAGLVVKEVAVVWRGGRRSTLSLLHDAPRMLYDLLRLGFVK